MGQLARESMCCELFHGRLRDRAETMQIVGEDESMHRLRGFPYATLILCGGFGFGPVHARPPAFFGFVRILHGFGLTDEN